MENKIWTENDKRRSQNFIEVIERRLKVLVPMIQPEPEGSTRDNLLVSIEVLEYDIKRSKSENTGIVSTKIELGLEQTQQGSSHEVSVSTKGVEELKRNVRIKGVKKEALHTLRQKPGQYICCQNHKDDS
ncbi:hypothetical protein Tco_1581018 [Tanacetum coccineum]